MLILKEMGGRDARFEQSAVTLILAMIGLLGGEGLDSGG